MEVPVLYPMFYYLETDKTLTSNTALVEAKALIGATENIS
jgi:hypothetical protein